MLETGAVACVECGTRVGEGRESEPLEPNRNTLSYQEDKNTRSFNASLTDSAINDLGGVFGELFAQRGASRVQLDPRRFSREGAGVVDVLKGLPPADPAAEERKETEQSKTQTPAADPNSAKAKVLQIFSQRGETLELTENRLKAKNQSDYVRRLTYLFVYAHEVLGRSSTSLADIRAVLKVGKVFDASGNAKTWLRKRIGIVDDGEDRVKLNQKGREDAIAALTATLDPNTEDAWHPDRAGGPKKRAKKKA